MQPAVVDGSRPLPVVITGVTGSCVVLCVDRVEVATWSERERDQQPTQTGSQYVGEDAVVRAKIEWSKHPDLRQFMGKD